jgi:phosphohistidine swiveling domain-containing protein
MTVTDTVAAPAFPLPADMTGYWEWDAIATPWPYTPLSCELVFGAIDEGFSMGMDAFGSPYRLAYRTANGYAFASIRPRDLGTESFDERWRRYEATLARELPRLAERWEDEWLPAMLPGLERARRLNFASLSDAALLSTLDDLYRDSIERWTVHGQFLFVFVAASRFVDFYAEAFQPSDPTEPYQVLQGFPNTTTEAGHRLWRLSRMIRESPRLAELFLASDAAALPAALERSDDGRAFLQAFAEYLDAFGWRNDLVELADPTWREDARVPLHTLKGYVGLDDSADPGRAFQQAVARREELLARSRERLAGDPERLARFEALYTQAAPYLRLSEDHNFYIDQMGVVVLRPPVLELGRRLVERGVLDQTRDVFMLTRSEIRLGVGGSDQRALAARRRSELTHWATVVPPATIGEPPADQGPPDPLGEGLAKLFGASPAPSREQHVLRGIGASRGVARGTAKVVRRLEEAGKVQAGDVLVCDMTMPAWTPLFSLVSAVVADTGGMLSHCAIVAREYGLPCVVSTRTGTSTIADGMLLTVDGGQGVVRMDARGPPSAPPSSIGAG